MSDSTSAVTNLQKLIKQLQKDALQQTLKQHADPLAKIHTIMRENSLTPDLVAMSYKPRKPRAKKDAAEGKKPVTDTSVKVPALQK